MIEEQRALFVGKAQCALAKCWLVRPHIMPCVHYISYSSKSRYEHVETHVFIIEKYKQNQYFDKLNLLCFFTSMNFAPWESLPAAPSNFDKRRGTLTIYCDFNCFYI